MFGGGGGFTSDDPFFLTFKSEMVPHDRRNTLKL